MVYFSSRVNLDYPVRDFNSVSIANTEEFHGRLRSVQIEAPHYIMASEPLVFDMRVFHSGEKSLAGKDAFGHSLFSSSALKLPKVMQNTYPAITLAETGHPFQFVVSAYGGTQGGKPAYHTFSREGEGRFADENVFISFPSNPLIEYGISMEFNPVMRADSRLFSEIRKNGFTVRTPADKLTPDNIGEMEGDGNFNVIYSTLKAAYARSHAYNDDALYSFPSYGIRYKDIMTDLENDEDEYSHHLIPWQVPSESIKFFHERSVGDWGYDHRTIFRNLNYVPPKLRDMALEQKTPNGDEVWGNGIERYLVRKGNGSQELPNSLMHYDTQDGEIVRVFDWGDNLPQ